MSDLDNRAAMDLEGIVKQNVRALVRVSKEQDARRSLDERVADSITAFAGTVRFAYVHASFFGGWIAINAGVVPGIKPFDPFPFVMLAMLASVEAIFLSTFVLISQNRSARLSEQRAELDLQINLLAERELTEILQMVEAISKKLDIPVRAESVEPLKQGVSAEAVLDHIEDARQEQNGVARR